MKSKLFLVLLLVPIAITFLLALTSKQFAIYATPYDDAVDCGSGDNHGRCDDSMRCHGDWECNSGRCVDGVCRGSPEPPGGNNNNEVKESCDANRWGGWSSCTASCGGGTQSRTNTCGTNQIQSCNTQACPTPTQFPSPTPTPDLRFQFQFMGVKLGTLPSAQNRKIFAQGYLDPGCYHETKEPVDAAIRQRAAQTCAFFYDPQTPSNPLAGFTDFYNYYGKFLKDTSAKVYTVIKQSIFSF